MEIIINENCTSYSELNEGGVERGVVELNREFVKLGIESYIISNGGKLVEQIIKDGGKHITF